jgi:hypothetical protein
VAYVLPSKNLWKSPWVSTISTQMVVWKSGSPKKIEEKFDVYG